MGAKSNPGMTHTQIEKAVRYFTAHGGFIRKLPDQKVAQVAMVGSRGQSFLSDSGMGLVQRQDGL
jgi:hypothetical protein